MFYLDRIPNEPTSIVIEIVEKIHYLYNEKLHSTKNRLPITDNLSEISSLGKYFFIPVS